MLKRGKGRNCSARATASGSIWDCSIAPRNFIVRWKLAGGTQRSDGMTCLSRVMVWQMLAMTSGSRSTARKQRITKLTDQHETQPVQCSLGSRENNPFTIAVKLVMARFMNRIRCKTDPDGADWLWLPPDGPATPVTLTATLAPVRCLIPRDISKAVCSLTAPCFSKVCA